MCADVQPGLKTAAAGDGNCLVERRQHKGRRQDGSNAAINRSAAGKCYGRLSRWCCPRSESSLNASGLFGHLPREGERTQNPRKTTPIQTPELSISTV